MFAPFPVGHRGGGGKPPGRLNPAAAVAAVVMRPSELLEFSQFVMSVMTLLSRQLWRHAL